MEILFIWIFASLFLCFILYMAVKNIDYLQKFKENSFETKAKINYIDEIGSGDNIFYEIVVSFMDNEGINHKSIVKEYVLRSEFKIGEEIVIRYQKSDPTKVLFLYDFEPIEKPKTY